MRVGTGLSSIADSRAAAMEASLEARGELRGQKADLAVVFASPHHAGSAQAVVEAIHEAVSPGGLIGCVAEGVVSDSKEVEEGPAVSVWLGSLPSEVTTFDLAFVQTESGGGFAGWRFAEDEEDVSPFYLLICDPFTFPVDHLLHHLNQTSPASRVMGGMASGARRPGETILFKDRSVLREGAVGVSLTGGVAVHTIVSQGCRPIGRSYTVTGAERNLIRELGGQPPLERLKETMASLTAADRELVSRGLHVGRVIDEYKAEHGQGDFLIRGVIGVDPQSGALAVGDHIGVGETVQFHVRDAATADEELRSLLERAVHSSGSRPAGALLFTCNGRGSRMFPSPDHDAGLVSSYLGQAPLAGFFCAGELGPVGGRNFVHGFTASLAVFLDEPRLSSSSSP